MEADLIHKGVAGTDIDLSELHLAYFTYNSYYDEKTAAKATAQKAPALLT